MVTRKKKEVEPTPQYALAAALALAAKRGWSLFPLKHGTRKSHKSAAFSDGREWGYTNDPDEIRQDFNKHPDAGIGIPLEVNGLIVLDWESLAGHGVDGLAARKL